MLTKEVEASWHWTNKEHYIEKGYKFSRYGEKMMVDVFDLPRGSHIKIEVMCDYCLKDGIETIIKKTWKRYVRDNLESVVNTDCCASCQPIKTKECNLINYGVESTTNLPEVQEKIKQFYIDNYGVDHNMKVPEIREKALKTLYDNYGVENPTQNPALLEKAIKTRVERFGSTNVYSDEKVLNKIIQTNLKTYGTEWPMQNDEVMKKSKETMYKHGTAPCSKQQKYLYRLLGGELNYPVDRLSLDIAFPKEKIYIEYDGNGHNLSVKLGAVTQEDFATKERRRYYFLRSQGWKKIKIESPYDYLPSDEVLLREIENAKEHFQNTESYFYLVKIGGLIDDKNFGRLRRVTDEDIVLLKEGEAIV